MPRFEPFPGIRYAPEVDADEVVAPPYDVMSDAERASYAARSRANAVHFDAPVAEGADPYGEAARVFSGLQADGTLVVDDTDSLYVYRMTNGGRHTTGVIGALGIGDDDVLPHEQTTKKAKSDRLDLLRATRANLSPIWGLSLAKGLAELCTPPERAPDMRAVDPDGVVHELWRLADPTAIDRIVERIGSEPVVIADGHHRYETCGAYRAERGPAPGAYDLTMTYVVELTDDELDVQPIHRLLHGAPAEVIASRIRLPEGDAMTLVGPTRSWTFGRDPSGPELDTEQLAVALEGIEGLEVAYQHGDVAAAVQRGEAAAAVIMQPVTVATIQDYAHRRDRMPPKTTYFFPKPRTGFVFRDLG